MVSCPACAAAELNPCAGLYHASCDSCSARLIAGGVEAFRASSHRTEDRAALRSRIAVCMPVVPPAVAWALVRDWWRRMRGLGAAETTFTRAGVDG